MICTKCKQEKPPENFYPDKRYLNGFATWCRDCHKEYRAQRYLKTRAKTLAQNKNWGIANPEHRKQLNVIKEQRRRARKRNAVGIASVEQIEGRKEMYGNRCWMCGKEATGMDHVIPLAIGGANWPSNLRPVCQSCNASKGVRKPCQLTLMKLVN